MKRERSVPIRLPLLAVIALPFTLVLSAQVTRPVSSERTVTGCLKRTGSNDKGSFSFLLTHTSLGNATFRLSPIGNLKLASFVGHKVRVTGRIEKEEPRTGGPLPPDGVDEKSNAGKPNDSVIAPAFIVRTIQSLTAKCAG